VLRVACDLYSDLRVGAVAREGGSSVLEALEEAGVGLGTELGQAMGAQDRYEANGGVRRFDAQSKAPMHVRLEFMLSRHILRHANSREPGIFRVLLAQDGPQSVVSVHSQAIRAVFDHACRSQRRHWERRHSKRWGEYLFEQEQRDNKKARANRRMTFGIGNGG